MIKVGGRVGFDRIEELKEKLVIASGTSLSVGDTIMAVQIDVNLLLYAG